MLLLQYFVFYSMLTRYETNECEYLAKHKFFHNRRLNLRQDSAKCKINNCKNNQQTGICAALSCPVQGRE